MVDTEKNPVESEVKQEEPKQSPEAKAAQMEADARAKMIAEGNAQSRLSAEENNSRSWWSKKAPEDSFLRSKTDPTEQLWYDRTYNLFAGKDKQAKPVNEEIGVSKNGAAPLHGNMKKLASGVSNTIKNGVTPNNKPKPGLKSDGPKQKAPKLKAGRSGHIPSLGGRAK